jgi:hypothetical protein
MHKMFVRLPSDESRLRRLRVPTKKTVIIFTFVSMIISSPIFMLANPQVSAAPLPTISTIPSAPSSIGQNGKDGDFTTQAALSSVTVKPSNNIVNTRAFYDITFTTASSGSIHKIIIDFPSGTGIGVDNLLVDTSGIGPGTAAKTGPLQITYTVANPTLIPPGRTIKLELSTIENPPNPGPSKEIMVTTKRPAGTTIDGPTQSADYRIKQIGTDDIADGSIVPFVIERSGSTVSVGPGLTDTAIASCAAGEQVVGGGYFITFAGANMLQVFEETEFANTWGVQAFNPDSTARSFWAYAECMPALP